MSETWGQAIFGLQDGEKLEAVLCIPLKEVIVRGSAHLSMESSSVHRQTRGASELVRSGPIPMN